MKNKKMRHIIAMGFTMFAAWFGAGNLIFPPYLGNMAGNQWFIGFIGFFIMDVGLALLSALMAIGNRRGNVSGVVEKAGRIPGIVMVSLVMICIGPGLAIPRCAAVTYEIGVLPLFGSMNTWVFGAIFFLIVLALTIRPAKIVDIVGNVLTPILLIVMVILIIVGIVNPISSMGEPVEGLVPLKEGLLQGYQTMDGLGGFIPTFALVCAAASYGYTDKKETTKLLSQSSILGAILLGLIYGGLTLLGATASGASDFSGLDQAPLLIKITQTLLGTVGQTLLSITVLMACLTTAISLTGAGADHFAKLFKGKVKQEYIVIVIVGVSYVISNIGLNNIISISAPILSVLYPPMIVLVVLTVFDNVLKNKHVAGFGAYAALIYSILEVFVLTPEMVAAVPFGSLGLGWIVPAVIGCVIGFFVKDPHWDDPVSEEA
ncbi:MAG TPA: branched-chain amino acid transport system II carrier protein [Candidatus Blautia intestinigallinarum]|nr:branched-chain amino acid transport system II carrier protein [Candidatus Blautia intestinigallinarum]